MHTPQFFVDGVEAEGERREMGDQDGVEFDVCLESDSFKEVRDQCLVWKVLESVAERYDRLRCEVGLRWKSDGRQDSKAVVPLYVQSHTRPLAHG